MSFSRQLFRLSQMDTRLEFTAILAWMLFFPRQETLLYFLTSALLITLFTLRHLYFMKNTALSSFSFFLLAFNLLLLFSIFFAGNHNRAFLWSVDIFLISGYFILAFFNKQAEEEYFLRLGYLLAVMSSFELLHAVLGIFEVRNLFLGSPILQGIASGIGVVIALHFLLRGFRYLYLGMLLLNLAGVFVSQSKAAFIGLVVLGLWMGLKKKKILIPVILGVAVLTAVVPNPIREMFLFSIERDPYAGNRLDIWKMSVRMLGAHLPWGVGPDNFSEVARAYNFKQPRGPANYWKVPRYTHNDYLKLLAETGIAGLLILAFFAYLVIKKLFFTPGYHLSLLLLLYILFQALLFNVVFLDFFFFIFLFLLKNLFEDSVVHTPFTPRLKSAALFLLAAILLVGYVLPYWSGRLLRRAGNTTDMVARYNLLERAQYLAPLDASVYYSRAVALHPYFKGTGNPDAFYSAIEYLKKAQRLNRYYINAYLLESDLYRLLIERNTVYPGLCDEILAPLTRAEQYDPLNPFIKMRKAETYLHFQRKETAVSEARKALALEPDYVAALYFLRDHSGEFPDQTQFDQTIRTIRKKAATFNPAPGSYLHRLYRVPGKGGGGPRNNHTPPAGHGGETS